MQISRKIVENIRIPHSDKEIFHALLTPSSICKWWQASCAIVVPVAGGLWAVSWGNSDKPDYVTYAMISVFDPPHRLTLGDYYYYARKGPLSFNANLATEFTIAPADDGGSVLQIVQDGFPVDDTADEFYASSVKDWRETLENFRLYLAKNE